MKDTKPVKRFTFVNVTDKTGFRLQTAVKEELKPLRLKDTLTA